MAISATNYATLKNLLCAMLSGNTYVSPQVPQKTMFSFIAQLFSNSLGTAALSAAKNNQLRLYLRSVLTDVTYSPSDADLTTFFSQLSADSAGSANLPAAQYNAILDVLRAALCDSAGFPTMPSVNEILSLFGSLGGVNFNSLLTSPSSSIQTDLGLDYGSSLLQTAGSAIAVGLSGSITGINNAKPIRVTTTAGALGVSQYSVSYDGGSTVAQTGATAASVPLSAVPGANITFTSATYVGNEVYVATCAKLADQSGNGNHFVQATASAQPQITVGLNGRCGLLFDGVNDFLACGSLTLAAPGTTPTYLMGVFRIVTWSVNAEPISCQNFAHAHQFICATGTPGIAANSGSQSVTRNTLAVNTFGCCEAWFNNSASDYVHIGTDTDQLGILGNNASSSGRWIGQGESGQFLNFEMFAFVHASAQPADRAAIRSAVTANYGNTVNV